MRRLVAGGAAVALAGVGGIALAGPLSAQEEPEFEIVELDAVVDPATTGPGGAVTVSSVDPCIPLIDDPELGVPAEQLGWVVAQAGAFPGWEGLEELEAIEDLVDPESLVDAGIVELADDGSWTVELTAPETPGDYEFIGICLPGDVGAMANLGAEALGTLDDGHHGGHELPRITLGVYGPELFTVETGETPPTPTTTVPTTSPTETPPAVPVPGEPEFTG